MSRKELLIEALKVGKSKGYAKSKTGMYRCEDYEGEGDNPPLLDVLNVCAICLFVEDEPYNFGTDINPTPYDGDCDDCGGDSLPYCE
tara:strand:+ start:3191 stop:3451 length:261 start_codon:yes stop_codon:yes gene_type:complete